MAQILKKKYQANNSTNKNNVSNTVATSANKPNLNNLGKPPVEIMYGDKNTNTSTTPTKPINKPNSNSNNSLQNNSGNVGNNTQNNNSYNEGLSKLEQDYKNYLNELQTQKVNANNEIAIAEQNTAKYIDNYLKSQGLYGSGMGSSLNLGNINQANNLRNQTTQAYNTAQNEAYQAYQNSINDYKTTYDTEQLNKALSNIDSMLTNGKTKEEILEYLNKYQNNPNISSENKEYINEYLEMSGATSWEDERKNSVQQLANLINQGSDNVLITSDLRKIAQKMNSAKTYDEYLEAVKEYEDFVVSETLGGQTVEQVIQGQSNPNHINNINSVQDFYDRIDPGIMVGGGMGGVQDTYVGNIINYAKNNQLKNNIIIDINKGGGKTYVLYSDGVFYKLGSSIPSQYSNLPKYDETNLKNMTSTK